MTNVRRVNVVDGMGQLFAHTLACLTAHCTQDSFITEAWAQEREDEAVVVTVITADIESVLNMDEPGMAFSVQLFKVPKCCILGISV